MNKPLSAEHLGKRAGQAAQVSSHKPRSQYLNLEARILFDAAGAVSVDSQLDDSARVAEAQRIASEQAKLAVEGKSIANFDGNASIGVNPGQTVVIVDARVADYQNLLQGLDSNAIVRIIQTNEDGLKVIGQVLGSVGSVSNLQIVSHGQSGLLSLGNRIIDNDSFASDELAAELRGWQTSLTANADILLLGCDVAQGVKGQDFVQKLADLTQADISASTDDTGAANLGGNWNLEFVVGSVESRIAFSDAAVTSYEHLLPAGPTTTITVDAKPLIGSVNNSGSVTLLNTGTVGYAPYIAVAFDATGKDPSNTNPTPIEGVSYVAGSASYLGAALPAEYILTFAGGVASSPSVTNAAGVPIVFNASDFSGMTDGDQLVIFRLPLGSFVTGQPDATVNFKYNVGANADSANALAEGGTGAASQLNIVSRGLFTLGDTPTGLGGAIVQGAGTVASAAPIWFKTSYENTSREYEQVPGANDKQLFQAKLDIAPGQTVLSNAPASERFISRLSIPPNISFDLTDVTLRNGSGATDPIVAGTTYAVVDKVTGVAAVQDPLTKIWTSPAGNGVEIRATAPIGSYTGNLTLNVGYYIPRTIISVTTGDDVPQTFDAKHTGQVRFADADDAQNQSFVADPSPIVINYQTIQIQKGLTGPTGNALDAANPAGVRSGDIITYTLNFQVGDYYGLRNVLVTDVLPDGLDYNGDASITLFANGQSRSGSLTAFNPINNNTAAQTINTQGVGNISVGGNGKWVLQFDVSGFAASTALNSVLPTGAAAGDLLGDVFADNTTTGLTVGTITFTSTVRDQYRVAANGNPATGTKINENDLLVNNTWISGNLIQNTNGSLTAATLADTGILNSDISSASTSIKDGNLLTEIYAINGIRVDSPTVPKNGAGNPIITPGDNVTYRLRYDLTQGDYTDLKLTAFLPDPVFSASDANADGTPDSFSKATDTIATTGISANWAQAGRYTVVTDSENLAPLSLAGGVAGVASPTANAAFAANTIAISTTPLAGGNSITFTLPNATEAANPGGSTNLQTPATAQKVDILFTVRAKDTNFAPELILAAQGREVSQRSVNDGATTPTPLPDNRVLPVVIGQPVMRVSLGVLSTGASNQDGFVPLAGSVTAGSNSGITIAAAGTGGAPFTGIVSNAGQIDGNMTNVDANDTVRFGFAIENSGTADAYNVRTQVISPPAGFRFVSSTADVRDAGNNFRVTRGDGTLLVEGTDYSVSGNVVSFIDRDINGDSIIDTYFETAKPNGSPRTDGKNVVVITFDTVADNAAASLAYAGATTTATAGVDRATGSPTGTATNFVPTPVTNSATVQNAKPQADIRWQGDSTDGDKTATADDTVQAGDAAGADQMVIGDRGFFDLKITIPEGQTKGLFADINLPAGMRLDTTFNAGAGYEIITTSAGVGANGVGLNGEIAANFGGVITNNSATAANISAISGILGNAGVGARINLGDIANPSTTSTNSTANNSFVIRVRAIADNQTANQLNVGQTLTSGTVYTEGVDVVAGTGGSAANVTNTSTANDPTVTIVEPIVTTVTTVIAYDVDSNTAGAQGGTSVDQFDIVEYTIRLANPGPINAFDLAFNDVFPSYLVNDASLQIASVTSGSALVNGAATSVTSGDFVLNTGTRTLNFNSASNIDLLAGGFIEIKVRGTVNASAAAVPSFTNSAETTWTSLNDAGIVTSADERSGALGGQLLANGGTTIDDGTGASSATGVNQALTTAGLNNYRSASSATIPVVAIQPVLSRIGGLTDTSANASNNLSGDTKDGSPSTGTPQDMVVGEVVRFRMVTRIPSGVLPDVALQPTLPPGYTFLNDNTARVAFVSDVGITSSLISGAGLVKGDGSDGTGPVVGGNAAIFGSIQNNLTSANFGATDPRIASVAPTVLVPSANIITIGNGSATSPQFLVGNITNNDNDIDDEYIVIEFNAVVNNTANNQQATNLDTSFVVTQNATTSNNQVSNVSNITRDRVVEPYIATVNKQIVDFTAPSQGSPNTNITLADSFTNSGLAPAYDVTLVDAGMPTGVNPVFSSVTVGANTYSSIVAATAAGITVTANGSGFDVTVLRLAVGESVTLRYTNDVPTNATQPSNASTQATVRYTSTPGLTQTFGASTNGTNGAATGERNGTGAGLPASAIPIGDSSGALNNYSAADTAGFGIVSGTLWNDTGLSTNMAGTSANNIIDAGEQLLSGVTVNLLWAGPDGNYATTADNRTLTTMTNASGQYSFGALPSGSYRITTGTSIANVPVTDAAASGDTDTLAMRFDRDGGTLGTIDVTLGDGANQATRDFSFVEANDSPTIPTKPVNYGTVNDNASKVVNGITFADIDGNAGTIETVTIQAVNGLGSLSASTGSGVTVTGSGTGTITLRGTLTDINAFVAADSVTFTPITVPATSGEVLRFTINDEGSRGDANSNGLPSQSGGTGSPDRLTATTDIAITILTQNTAPFVRIGTTSPNPVNVTSQIGAIEDTTLVFTGSNLISIGDNNDAGTALTITLTVPPGVGSLTLPSSPSVTVTGGASGTNTIAISGKLVDLNVALVALSFTPSADANTTVISSTLTVVITDSGNGGYGGTLNNVAINQVIRLPITPINDAPLFGVTTPTSLPAVNEDTTSVAVSVLTAFPDYTDPKDNAKPNGVDNRVGVLLVNNASTTAQGEWQYLNGTVWTNVPRNLSSINALYLPDATQLRFVPTLNYNGTPGVLTARLVENDQSTTASTQPDLPANSTGSTFGATNAIRMAIDLSAGVGGTSRVSANTRDVGITITPVNELPTVIAPGNTVAAGLAIGDIPVSFTGANAIVVADPSDFPNNDGPVVCVVITPTANGRPYLSALVPGVTQVSGPAVGSLPATAGTPIILEGTLANLNLALQNLQYRSAQFYNGLDTFTVRIEDKANGGPGQLTATTTVNVNNVPLNDRPVVNGPEAPLYEPLLPGMMTPPRTVQEIFGQRFTDPRDAPTNNGGDVFAGVAVIGTPPVGQGTYQYSSDGGATWIDIAPSTTPANAVVLSPTALVRFKSNAAYIGETETLKAVLIETDQKAPFQGDLLSRASVPLDSATSTVPVTGTILDLSKLEATETSTTNNAIGRSRFSSLTKPMEITVRVDPPATSPSFVAPLQAFVPIAVSSFVGLTNDQRVASVIAESQSLADAQTARSNTLFNQGLGNSGLQPHWLAIEPFPGSDAFVPLAAFESPKPPIVFTTDPVAPVDTAEAKAKADDCAKPRKVAKPRFTKVTPSFAPGSDAAKRFSEQIKRARVRSRC
jgi:large repetitive protein